MQAFCQQPSTNDFGMDFKTATDVLIATRPVTAADIAVRLGKDAHTIRRARMSGPNSRTAPIGWEPVVADLAEEHANQLEVRIKQLRRLVSECRQLNVSKDRSGHG
jgi:hypothetical protein